MSISRPRFWLVAGVFLVGVAALTVAAVGSTTSGRSREISLIARANMAFYADGGSTPNPVLHARPGERLRISVTNAAPGMVHDLAIDGVSAATPLLSSGQTATIEFAAPDTPGTYEYRCRPHAVMMKGTLLVEER